MAMSRKKGVIVIVAACLIVNVALLLSVYLVRRVAELHPTWPQSQSQSQSRYMPIILLSQECTEMSLTHGQVSGSSVTDVRLTKPREGKTTWWDCTLVFSDGSKFRRVGDARP
jgi:hypothetical protein